MERLTQMRCVACRRDAPTMTDAEITEFHRQVSDWGIFERDGIKRLRRAFSVDDFALALAFTKKVGELTEEEGITQRVGFRYWCVVVRVLRGVG
jgi:4a-hydroxytetrahydrobiopterin dehydratase